MNDAVEGTDRIVLELRRRILHGHLLPGEKLRQEEIAGQLGVSRVPLREALLILSNQGLLDHRRNSGFVVAKRSAQELEQVHLLLHFLEREIEKSLEWPDPRTLAQMTDLNDRMRDLVDSESWIELVDLNHDFHRVLWSLSPLNLVVAETERIWSLADAYITQAYRRRTSRSDAVVQHVRILEALTARDRDALLACAADHRSHTHVNVLGVLGD